ncbi:hypothetical protein [Bacillus mycoides]|nr:hypothetical protein [Bacillus mycoides]MDM5429922.1 hypothetical protein [Bacillus mycoides]
MSIFLVAGLKLMRAFIIIALTFLSIISWDAFFKDKSDENNTIE